ncbi:MAG: DHH family phosphoesterase [Bacilli bacterium]|nr:DHH family phosphoesterase [Bacilli bacterium]
MNKTLSKLRNTTFAIFASEALVILIAAVLYFFTPFWDTVIPAPNILLYYLLAIIAFVVFDALFFYFAIIYLKKVREQNDLDAAVLVGGDIDDAYDFGKIGMIVIDDADTVIWTNGLFRNLHVDIIDHNIFEWQPALKDLVDAPVNKVITITFNYKDYQVKFLSEPRLFILKDTTELNELQDRFDKQSMVLGVINIDNFDDFASDTDDSAAAINVIRNIIFDYAKEFKVVLRRVKSDTYFTVCNYNSLKSMIQDGFSILKKARDAGKEEDTPLTLSIGFAHKFPEAGKLNEAASIALQSALARGGDQCVVSEFGKDLQYFGGKTTGVESTSKVKMRSRADSLINNIKTSSNIIIMGHDKMDMDALGSCLGVRAICEWCSKESKIVYNPKQVEAKTREAFNNSFNKDTASELTVSPDEALGLIKESTLLIVCDIRVPLGTMAPKLLDRASKIILIDHHRKGNRCIEDNVILDVSDPGASSASELVAEMIRFATANPRIDIPQSYATIMLSGIFLDSMYFKSKTTGMKTFEACEILKGHGADNALAAEFLKDELQEYQLINEMVSQIRFPFPGIATAMNTTDLVEKETLAKVANRIMELKGINACFVFGRTASNICGCSARSDGTVNVQLICEKLNGGGHFNASAIAFRDMSDVTKAHAQLVGVLNNYLEQARTDMHDEEGEN